MTTDKNSGIPKVQATAPERINLTIADEEFYRDEPFPAEFGAEICWSSDEPVAVCVPYVRADLAPSAAEVQALVEELGNRIEKVKGGTAGSWREFKHDTLSWLRDELAALIPRKK